MSNAESKGRSRSLRNPSVSGGSFGEQEGEGILLDVQGELVKNGFQGRDHIHLSFFEGVQH